MATNVDSSAVGQTPELKTSSLQFTDLEIDSIFDRLTSPSAPEPHTTEPESGLDSEVASIFKQARAHRDRLVVFFITYTWVFSGLVLLIIIAQGVARAFLPGKESVELIPYWALNLLVVGLIGQFITLLTIVTRKVWLFEAFFKHANGNRPEVRDNVVSKE